jgi:hypothetical protein
VRGSSKEDPRQEEATCCRSEANPNLSRARLQTTTTPLGQDWKQWQIDLLGTASDAELAARLGRTITAIRVMRNKVGRRQPPRTGLS